MVIVACCFWTANGKTQPNSRCFDETWVEKLYRGFARNLTRPFRFVAFTDRYRKFSEPRVEQEPLRTEVPHYGCLIEPFRMGLPMIMCGLDMIVLRNVDHFADYCMRGSLIAAPRNPYQPDQLINPVVLVPAGHASIAKTWNGENDMDWLRKFPCEWIDDWWPGQVLSLKFHKLRDTGPMDARIVYMHGRPKAHELGSYDWIQEAWK